MAAVSGQKTTAASNFLRQHACDGDARLGRPPPGLWKQQGATFASWALVAGAGTEECLPAAPLPVVGLPLLAPRLAWGRALPSLPWCRGLDWASSAFLLLLVGREVSTYSGNGEAQRLQMTGSDLTSSRRCYGASWPLPRGVKRREWEEGGGRREGRKEEERGGKRGEKRSKGNFPACGA